VFVAVVAVVGVLEGAPAAEEDASLADLFVTGEGFVEEVEEVVVEGEGIYNVLDIFNESH
jgi:hypothetical protein